MLDSDSDRFQVREVETCVTVLNPVLYTAYIMPIKNQLCAYLFELSEYRWKIGI